LHQNTANIFIQDFCKAEQYNALLRNNRCDSAANTPSFSASYYFTHYLIL